LQAKIGDRQPFPAKPEVEIWRKPNRINELAVLDFLFNISTIYDVSTTIWPLKSTFSLVGFFKIAAAAILDF